MQIENNIVFLQTNRIVTDSPSTLRGFIGKMFPNNPIIHHHSRDGTTKLIYSYPKIQYKIIDGRPIILGLLEGVKVVEDISAKLHQLELKSKIYTILNKKHERKEVYISITNNRLRYKFLTPWLALNEESYRRYKKNNPKEKQKQLESILVGNIISMAKGLEYVVTDKIIATIDVKEMPMSLKGVPMLGFLGNFSVNFEIPDYWGIGKSVSRGFGTIKRVREWGSGRVRELRSRELRS
ncbi:MAG TPA: hypothetical protein DCY12_03130 [Candidatus Atribacteria bacterium]|nr:hypothetical protein [Candidatus Atribacteria bacterium]